MVLVEISHGNKCFQALLTDIATDHSAVKGKFQKIPEVFNISKVFNMGWSFGHQISNNNLNNLKYSPFKLHDYSSIFPNRKKVNI